LDEIRYPQYSSREYGPIITSNTRNNPMFTPDSFFMGNVLTTHPDELVQQLAAWQRFKRSPKDFKVELFPLEREYLVWLGERHEKNGNKQRRRRKLLDLSLEELTMAVIDKIQQTSDKNAHLWFNHGHTEHSKRAITQAFGGSINMTGYVKQCGDKKEIDQSKFHFVNIDNPYFIKDENAEHGHKPVFTDLGCKCMDARWDDVKRGDSEFQVACKHIGALLEYIGRNPEALRTYIRLKKQFRQRRTPFKFFSPFHTDHVRPDVLKAFEGENLPHIARGTKQPRLDHLKIDVLLAHLMEGQKYADISKQLLRLPVYDINFINMIKAGEIAFEVAPNSQLFGVESSVDARVRKLNKSINRALYREGFTIHGYCYEKRNSAHEVIAVNYLPNPEKPRDAQGEVRVLYHKNYPPVLIRRTPLRNAKIHPFREHKTHAHPFAELFKNTRRFDDRIRKYTNHTVELPPCFIHNDFLPDYAKLIQEYFPGGLKRLMTMAKKPGQHANVNLPSPGLVGRMMKIA